MENNIFERVMYDTPEVKQYIIDETPSRVMFFFINALTRAYLIGKNDGLTQGVSILLNKNCEYLFEGNTPKGVNK